MSIAVEVYNCQGVISMKINCILFNWKYWYHECKSDLILLKVPFIRTHYQRTKNKIYNAQHYLF